MFPSIPDPASISVLCKVGCTAAVCTADVPVAAGLRAAHLVGARQQAADAVVAVGLDGVEVEAEHQVPPLHHNQLVALILHSVAGGKSEVLQ